MSLLLLARQPLDLFRLLLEAGPVAHATLAVLAVMSVLTWAAWVSRWLALRRLLGRSRVARQEFLRAGGGSGFEARVRELPEGPVSRLFAAAWAEHRAIHPEGEAWTLLSAEAGRQLLARTLASRRAEELARARRWLPLLATIGATAPFVGLFGTVWGVMVAFAAIGTTRSADLAVVAPGIAEALINTALGLVAAIPAVWAYNALGRDLRSLGLELERFAADYLNAHDRAVARAGR